VLNAAGVTGRPNVDWCETHKVETIRSNVIGCLNLADVCHERGIHMTYYGACARCDVNDLLCFMRIHACAVCALARMRTFLTHCALTMPCAPPPKQPKNKPKTGTGCIFHYDESKPEGSGIGFTEADKPNFTGSYYSYTKAMVESLLREYPNVLTLRVRMPIVADLTYPRNFITKVRDEEGGGGGRGILFFVV
jgi:nucleoside-diphosphate-sugar epimerase